MKAKLAAELSAAVSGDGDGAAGGTSKGSEATRRVDALEAGDYDATGLEEVDLAERFTQSLLEDASEGY